MIETATAFAMSELSQIQREELPVSRSFYEVFVKSVTYDDKP